MITKRSHLLPRLKELPEPKLKKLQSLCQSLKEILSILNSVAQITPGYCNKELYVLKRIDAFLQNENNYKESGVDQNVFEGKQWELGQLPSDPDIVSAVFCALLDYSVKDKRQHLYDSNLSHSQIFSQFGNKDLSLVNRQPKQMFRAHFEVIIGKKSIVCPSVS